MIQLVKFNNNWKLYFQHEKKLLSKALNGQQIVDIEHIGATSVVLCQTCGTIDLVCSIPNKIELITLKNILERKGYQYIDNLSNQDCFLFIRRNKNKQIVATIRLVEHASIEYNKLILFKYYLKERKSHVLAYNTFRQTLLEQYEGDAKKYQAVKKSYIESILNDFCEIK